MLVDLETATKGAMDYTLQCDSYALPIVFVSLGNAYIVPISKYQVILIQLYNMVLSVKFIRLLEQPLSLK